MVLCLRGYLSLWECRCQFLIEFEWKFLSLSQCCRKKKKKERRGTCQCVCMFCVRCSATGQLSAMCY